MHVGPLSVVVLIVLTGCVAENATKTLNIHSVPEGATLTERRTGAKHKTPVSLQYPVDQRFVDANGCLTVNSFIAQWGSGVTMRPQADTIQLCGNRPIWTMTIHRPNAAGLEYDLSLEADHLARLRALKSSEATRSAKPSLSPSAQQSIGNLGFAIGYALSCGVAGGCDALAIDSPKQRINSLPRNNPYGRPGSKPYSVPLGAPLGSTDDNVPIWARKRDPMDTSTVCDMDIWGNSYCGLRR